LQWLEDKDILYVIGQSKNKVMEKLTQEKLEEAHKLYKETKQKVKLFDSFEYKAKSWDKACRIVAKVEITKKGENLRYKCDELSLLY